MARLHVAVTVAAVAVAAAGGVVAITLATRSTPPQPTPQKGKPPVARVLHTPAAAAIHEAFADWPHGSIAQMLKLQIQYPKDPVVQFYVGLAYAWAGYDNEAVGPLERAKKYGRDTPIEVQADTLLHPEDEIGDPTFQLAPGSDPTLERGAQLEAGGHRHSAERVFAAYARRHPADPLAQAAAAFALFDKDNPSLAFSHLGPIAKRFPRSQGVHFNIGLLLAWIGEAQPSLAEFRQTVRLGPGTFYGRDATKFVQAFTKAGTAPPSK